MGWGGGGVWSSERERERERERESERESQRDRGGGVRAQWRMETCDAEFVRGRGGMIDSVPETGTGF
jgi:hypothetical protein